MPHDRRSSRQQNSIRNFDHLAIQSGPIIPEELEENFNLPCEDIVDDIPQLSIPLLAKEEELSFKARCGTLLLRGFVGGYFLGAPILYGALSTIKGGFDGGFSSALMNGPFAIYYGYTFVDFLKGIPQNPARLLGLIFAFFPGIAGIRLGFDGAGALWGNHIFRAICSGIMGVNLVSTRGVGIMGILDDLYHAFIAPWRHCDKNSYDLALVKQEVEKNPQLIWKITRKDFRKGLSKGSLKLWVNNFNYSTHRQNLYWGIDLLAKIFLLVGALSTGFLWQKLGRAGWSALKLEHLLPITITMASNLIFYLRGSIKFPNILIDFCSRLFLAMYNPEGSRVGNGLRSVLAAMISSSIMLVAWESGIGMGFEAMNVELSFLNFLTPIYSQIVQFYAGVIMNGGGFMAFCLDTLPKFTWFNQITDFILKRIGAKEREEGEEASGTISISKQQVLGMLIKLSESAVDNVSSFLQGAKEYLLNNKQLQYLGLISIASPREEPYLDASMQPSPLNTNQSSSTSFFSSATVSASSSSASLPPPPRMNRRCCVVM